MSKKILKLYQANEDRATDINTQFTPVTIDVDFMSWTPKDIITNQEFDTGKTLDGKPIYGIYIKNTSISLADKNIIYATANDYKGLTLHMLNVLEYNDKTKETEIVAMEIPIGGGQIDNIQPILNFNYFVGFVFYTKK